MGLDYEDVWLVLMFFQSISEITRFTYDYAAMADAPEFIRTTTFAGLLFSWRQQTHNIRLLIKTAIVLSYIWKPAWM
jgi:hypothetical protein